MPLGSDNAPNRANRGAAALGGPRSTLQQRASPGDCGLEKLETGA